MERTSQKFMDLELTHNEFAKIKFVVDDFSLIFRRRYKGQRRYSEEDKKLAHDMIETLESQLNLDLNPDIGEYYDEQLEEIKRIYLGLLA